MAKGGDFDTRMRKLGEQVGSGNLVGTLAFDQVYAAYQHERMDLTHDTGKPKYVSNPLYGGAPGYVRTVAESVLDEGGPTRGMIDALEDFADEAGRQAPKDLSNLSRSDHPSVTDAGREVYDRPPQVHRLSREELRVLRRGRHYGSPGRQFIAGAPGKEAIDNPAYDPSQGGVIGRANPDPTVPSRLRRGSARR